MSQRTITITIALDNSVFMDMSAPEGRKAEARSLHQLIMEMPPSQQRWKWKEELLDACCVRIPEGFEWDIEVDVIS